MSVFSQGSDFDFNVRTLDAHTVTGYRFRSRWSEHLAGRDIKHCAVPGAGDFNTFEFSFAQRTTDVRARVIDGVKRTCNVEERNLFTVDLDHSGRANRDLLNPGNFDKLWHALSLLKSVLLQRNRRQTLKRATCGIDGDPNRFQRRNSQDGFRPSGPKITRPAVISSINAISTSPNEYSSTR